MKVKNVLVTGASRGIGQAIAIGLANSGCSVFVTSRNEEKLKKLSETENIKGFITADLSKLSDLENLAGFITKNKIDVLINNAGDYIYNEIENIDYEQISKIVDVNLKAVIYLSSKVTPYMKSQKWGRIVNIGSISGVMGEAGACIYSASKSGLIGFSRALGLELAQYGITVNTINPGWVETELGMKSIEDSEFSLEETLETIPQKRFVKPEEVEKMVEYLISEDAKGVTGQSINLCAGLSVGY